MKTMGQMYEECEGVRERQRVEAVWCEARETHAEQGFTQ